MGGVPRHWEYDDVFDALEQGCGDLLVELRRHIESVSPGRRLLLASRDIASPIEIPAWSRLTGHRLVAADHPFYLIERKHTQEPKGPNQHSQSVTKSSTKEE